MKAISTKKNVTIYDIAKEAGVSASMVSRVVSGNGPVAEKNRVLIKDLLKKYNYRPNAMARGLQRCQTGLIGFILPHIGNEYFSSVYYEFERHASADGYMTVLYNGKSRQEVESRIITSLTEARVEAVILMGGRIDNVNLEKKYVDEVQRLNEIIPCVACSERAFDFGCLGVHSNDRMACQLALEHLSEQGYKTMGIIGGVETTYPTLFRRRNLLEEATARGITVRPEWIMGQSFGEEDGIECIQRLLKLDKLPEVVCCMNDHVAFGAETAALDAGLRIPEDIAILGFDGVAASAMARPHITTIATDFKTFGKTIYEAMQAALQGEEYPALSLIDPRLVVRESTLRKK